MTAQAPAITEQVSNITSRRNFLRSSLTGLVGVAAGSATLLDTDDAAAAETVRRSEILLASFGGGARTLSFKNTHTGEELTTTYWRGGSYEQAALDEINYLLRDFRTGEVHNINKGLLNLLTAIRRQTGVSAPVNIVSGYRSPKTNAMLRRTRGEGVARQSYHVRGMAIDLRLPGYSTSSIARQARSMAVGGVGFYSSSDFVHVDVGPVRTW